MADVEQKCETCKFFLEGQGVPQGGMCRRYPPTVAMGQGPHGEFGPMGSSSTPVLGSGWCGEWQQGQIVKGAKTIPFIGNGKN